MDEFEFDHDSFQHKYPKQQRHSPNGLQLSEMQVNAIVKITVKFFFQRIQHIE